MSMSGANVIAIAIIVFALIGAFMSYANNKHDKETRRVYPSAIIVIGLIIAGLIALGGLLR